MKNLRLISLVLLILSCNLYANDPRILEWDEMMPEGYVESLLESVTNNIGDTSAFSFDDYTEEAQDAYDQLREKLESAPIVPELDNQFVKIAGFIVPIDFDFDTETFSDFLLVPYFGACIHTPPPPSNQIVYISSNKAFDQEWLDYAVWASGKLSTRSVSSDMAFAAYSMEDVNLEEYTEDE